MAIPLNKSAIRCEEIALASGKITPGSSARPLLYDISRNWRALLDASGFKSDNPGPWSEREELASEVIISALAYLRRIGCKDIEQLLRDSIERQAGNLGRFG